MKPPESPSEPALLAQYPEMLDDALCMSFPASDPVSLGRSHRVGGPIGYEKTTSQTDSEGQMGFIANNGPELEAESDV